MPGLRAGRMRIALDGAEAAELAYVVRYGGGTPVAYLHGLGSSKADFLGALAPVGLPGRTVMAFDFPGCGDSPALRPTPDVEELVDLAMKTLGTLFHSPPVLVGHSMGGLVALLLAHRNPSAVRAFVDVEGNLAPEDCFLSRRAVEWVRSGRGSGFMEVLQREERASGRTGHAQYAERFRREVSEPVFLDYSASIVTHSERDPLLDRFLELPMPKAFVYGEENAHLSYLPRLEASGVPLREIPAAGHFPLYTDPVGFFRVLKQLLADWGL